MAPPDVSAGQPGKPSCSNATTSVEICAAHGRGPCVKVSTNHQHGRVGLASGIAIGVGMTLLAATGTGLLAALAWSALGGATTYLLTAPAPPTALPEPKKGRA